MLYKAVAQLLGYAGCVLHGVLVMLLWYITGARNKGQSGTAQQDITYAGICGSVEACSAVG
jgi:hypothetical protein